jgi:sporulation protein YlmC with PRC-barrel domain
MNLSATSIIGDKVRNGSGDDLGKIEDIMIDVASGKVSYAVLSFGGFLGIGDKYFAVPLEAMRIDTEAKQFVLNESKERLKNAPGFDKDHWPSHSDTAWYSSVRDYYRVP